MGIFVTFEGIDGSGKSTAASMVKNSLTGMGYKVLLTQEPTDTYLGTVVKNIVLNKEVRHTSIDKKTLAAVALFLFSADRTVHLNDISSMLSSFDVVLCDRFIDSTYAYQAVYFKNKDSESDKSFEEFIFALNDFVLKQSGMRMDRTYLFDLEPESALKRLRGREGKFDGFDGESLNFFSRVRDNYLSLADRFKDRIKTLDADASAEDVAGIITEDIAELIKA